MDVKWITHKPKESGNYLAWILHKESKEVNKFYMDVVAFTKETQEWEITGYTKVLAYTELPEMPHFDPDLFSDKMEEFLDKVDKLCYKYNYELFPISVEDGLFIGIEGNGESERITRIDGDGRGK